MNIQFFHESASKKNPTRLAHGALCHVIGSALHALGRVRLLVGQDTARLQQVLSAHSQDTRSAVALLRLAANLLEVDIGKGCAGQIYTLAEHAGPYWANLFFLVWLVLALGYAMYVTVRIWTRP